MVGDLVNFSHCNKFFVRGVGSLREPLNRAVKVLKYVVISKGHVTFPQRMQ